MKKGRLFHNLTIYAWKELCQQFWLLAVLSMLFLILSLAVGPVAESLLSRGVAFSGLRFAVCAPSEDTTGALVERLTDSMKDVRSYAAFRSMPLEEAMEALEDGEVNAVLALPEHFVDGVLSGDNPDVVLILSQGSPLEGLLAAWVGQSAADLLTCAQRGIYAVLRLYDGSAPYDEVLMGINMEYISLALNRQDFFRPVQVEAGEGMDSATHYGLSLLLFLAMSLPALFRPVFSWEKGLRRRLASLGHGVFVQYGSGLWVCFCCQALLLAAPGLYLTGGNVAGTALAALFAGCWAAFCCAVTDSDAPCAVLGFGGGVAALVLGGGIVPPALLSAPLRAAGKCLPLGMLRRAMAHGGWMDVLGVALWCALLLGAAFALWRRDLRKEAGP